VRRADNLTTFMCRLSRNLETSASWNPQGLSRPVMVLLYLQYKTDTRYLLLRNLNLGGYFGPYSSAVGIDKNTRLDTDQAK
jgi:hypothetical protein